MSIPDFSGVRDAKQARVERALPFQFTDVRVTNGATGYVSGSGSWIGLAGKLTSPFVASTYSCFLDVWLNQRDQTGDPTFSLPLGEKISVPFECFAFTVRIVGAPPLDRLTIVSGYGMDVNQFVPQFAGVGSGGAAVSATIVSPLTGGGAVKVAEQGTPGVNLVQAAGAALATTVAGAVPVAPRVFATATPSATATSGAASVSVLAANAARTGGIIQNLGGSDPVRIVFAAAGVAWAAGGYELAERGAVDLCQFGGLWRGAVFAINDAAKAGVVSATEFV